MALDVGIDWVVFKDILQSHQFVIAAVFLTGLFGWLSLRSFLGPTIPKITLPLPPQARLGWRGDILQNPSIRGKDPNTIQCYCPATGQLIDTVKEATVADVDLAIQKAKAAQQKWRGTSFKQRALVLKTLLKFILENQGISLIGVVIAHVD